MLQNFNPVSLFNALLSTILWYTSVKHIFHTVNIVCILIIFNIVLLLHHFYCVMNINNIEVSNTKNSFMKMEGRKPLSYIKVNYKP